MSDLCLTVQKMYIRSPWCKLVLLYTKVEGEEAQRACHKKYACLREIEPLLITSFTNTNTPTPLVYTLFIYLFIYYDPDFLVRRGKKAKYGNTCNVVL
jgi:hypothetical protein